MVMDMDGNIVCDNALPILVGGHGGIPKVKGLVKLYENRLGDLSPPISVALYVGLTPTILVGMRVVGRERVILSTIGCENMVVTPYVEELTIPKGVII